MDSIYTVIITPVPNIDKRETTVFLGQTKVHTLVDVHIEFLSIFFFFFPDASLRVVCKTAFCVVSIV